MSRWSIRSKIITLLIVPMVALVGLWIFATAVALGSARGLVSARDYYSHVVAPGNVVIDELQQERVLSLLPRDSTGAAPALLVEQRHRTDDAIDSLRRQADHSGNDQAGQRLAAVDSALATLADVRTRVDHDAVTPATTMGRYAALIQTTQQLLQPVPALAGSSLATESRAPLAISRAREALSREDALFRMDIATARPTATDLSTLAQAIGARRYLFTDVAAGLRAADRSAYQLIIAGDAGMRLDQVEDRAMAAGRSGATVPVGPAEWQSAHDAVDQDLRTLEARTTASLSDQIGPAARDAFLRAGIVGGLGLIAIGLTIVLSVRIGRSLISRLNGLRQTALEAALDRLPTVVEQLRLGRDVAAEVPVLPHGDDEIGRVGHAFNEMQKVAIRAAVEEANLRRGLNDVFLNIARRGQTLLHRQLALLDRMERRTSDPEELADLFRLDHMATRMRRHAEDLVILAGAAPGRGWREPVAFLDVIRAAVSEVEDYARVTVRATPSVALVGRAVGDVIHLLAELIENATSFSPPETKVTVTGQTVPNGFAIEIEDRGLGLDRVSLEATNAILTTPPEFDPANTARLGHFVVARLAARHGIRVRLRDSPYGGVTAVTLVPSELVTEAPATGARPITAGLGPERQIHEGELVIAGTDRYGPAAPRQPATLPRQLEPPPLAAGATGSGTERVAPADPAAGATGSPVTEDGLPLRVRQANLSPKLREQPPAEPVTPTVPRQTRSPEQMRAMMAALQAGTVRGRQDAATRDAADPAGHGDGTLADSEGTRSESERK